MDWQLLKEGKCPKCSSAIIVDGLLSDFFHCITCGFKISEKRFNEIISSKRGKVRIREDNLSVLNNLGHKKTSEDYSDEIDTI